MIPSLSFVGNGGSLSVTSTFQDIPNLSFFLTAGATYRFETHFLYQVTAGTSPTAQPGMGGTCVASFVAYQMSIQTNNGGGGSHFEDCVLSNTSRQASSAITSLSTNLAITMEGLIVVQNAGTLTAQMRSGGTGVTMSVQSGGRFMLEQLA